MRAVQKALLLIAEHFGLEPGDKFTVTINHVGNPSIEYSRKITPEGVESGRYDRPTPWRTWEGKPDQEYQETGGTKETTVQ